MKKKRLFALMLAAGLAFSSAAVRANAEDLSQHTETSGEFTAAYSYDNPFKGMDLKDGVTISFDVKSTGDLHVLGTIFAITGSGDHEGRMYFTPGSYLGYNSGNHGGFMDANLTTGAYSLANDYIKEGGNVKITITASGFEVSVDGIVCYDQTILDDASISAGAFTSSSDFTPMLDFLANADTITFGAGSWWNGVGFDEANVDVTNFKCELADGTVAGEYFSAGESTSVDISGSSALEGVKGEQPIGYTAYYKFNGNLMNEVTGEYATLTGSTYAAIPNNEAAIFVPGISGKSLYLMGYDGIKLDAAPKSSNYTISFCVKINENPTKYTPMVFLCNLYDNGTIMGSDEDAQWMSIAALGWQDTLADGPMIWSRNVPGGALWNDVYTKANDSLGIDKWQNVTVVATGTTGKIYVNGAVVASGPVADFISENTAVYLGVNAWDEVFNGYMDDLYIYDRALSDAEVAALTVYSLTGRAEASTNGATATNTPAANPTSAPAATNTPEPTAASSSDTAPAPTTSVPAAAQAETNFPMVAVVLVVAAIAIVVVAVVVVKKKK